MIELISTIIQSFISIFCNVFQIKSNKNPELIKKISDFLREINQIEDILKFYTSKSNIYLSLGILKKQWEIIKNFEALYIEIKNLDVNKKTKNIDKFWEDLNALIRHTKKRIDVSSNYSNANNCSNEQIYMKDYSNKNFDKEAHYFPYDSINGKCLIDLNILKNELEHICFEKLSKDFDNYKKSLNKILK